MINRSDIKANTNNRFYQRGRDLYEAGKVLSLEALEEDGVVYVTGYVKGSGRNIYETQINIIAEFDYIESYGCACSAADSYYGMCKHCVATVLQYIDKCKNGMSQVETKEQTLNKLLENKGIEKGMTVPTNPMLKNNKRYNRRKNSKPSGQKAGTCRYGTGW